MKRTLLTLAALLLPVAPAIAGEVKIKNCTDERLLQHWFDRAITASSVDEILAP